jgi:hypothetical protein
MTISVGAPPQCEAGHARWGVNGTSVVFREPRPIYQRVTTPAGIYQEESQAVGNTDSGIPTSIASRSTATAIESKGHEGSGFSRERVVRAQRDLKIAHGPFDIAGRNSLPCKLARFTH